MTHPKTIAIRLMPKASIDRIGGMRVMSDGEERLVLYVTAPPDKNKANDAMIKLLAKYLAVPPSTLTILHGHTHRNKLVKIGTKNDEK